jgi:hypothetical protein
MKMQPTVHAKNPGGMGGFGSAPPPPPPPTALPLLTSLRLQWWFSRIASNLEVVSIRTDIGQ